MDYLLKQATLNKLAQTRLAVNYVLRNRYMNKVSGFANKKQNLIDFRVGKRNKIDPENAGTYANATYDDNLTMMNIKEPEKANWRNWLRVPWGTPFNLGKTEKDIINTADKTKRMQQKRDPKKIEEYKKYEGPH